MRLSSLMRPRTLIYLYRKRLRVDGIQELLAGIGVAVAVALVFAVTVASASITSAASQVVHTVIGPADLQLHARDSNGISERLLSRVERLPGVGQVAPLLEATATVQVPSGRRATVTVAGTDISLATLDGLAHTLPLAALSPGGMGLSQATAQALQLHSYGASGQDRVRLLLRGAATDLKVSAVLGHEAAGALAQAQVAVMPLGQIQRLAGLQGRVSRILVESKPGRRSIVEGELRALAAGKITVAPADQDIALLDQALGPSNQASDLFAGLAALLGFLFAFNAMLLTVPDRREQIADLRVQGTDRPAIVQMVLFQALCLGLLASLVGLCAGYGLAIGLFQQSPGYLTRAFTLGTSTVIGWQPVALALFGGLLATCLASMVPLLDLRRGRPKDAALSGRETQIGPSQGTRRLLAVATMSLLLLASGLFVLAPATAILACVALALATLCAVPLVLATVLRVAAATSMRYKKLTVLPLAVFALRAASWRSLALAATGAVALFGTVALGSSREDLLRGIDSYTAHYVSGADIWVVNPGDNQATDSFPATNVVARVRQIPGVAHAREYQGSFLNFGGRRVWVIAWPANSRFALLTGQIIHGSPAAAIKALRVGSAITVSDQIAKAQHVPVGGTLAVPTPTGVARYRVAATTTNFGWSPGALLMNTADYQRVFGTNAISAIGVEVQPGSTLTGVRKAIERQLGRGSGLEVLSVQAREHAIESSASEGLGQLGEIADLLVAAAIMAMVAGLWSSLRQRRQGVAEMRVLGGPAFQRRRVLLVESLLMLAAGCLTGTAAGVYGQVVIDSYLKHVTGFPVAGVATPRPLEISVFVIAIVLMIVSLPGWFASRAPATLALNE
jgi:putative ABC transport system permease protein